MNKTKSNIVAIENLSSNSFGELSYNKRNNIKTHVLYMSFCDITKSM